MPEAASLKEIVLKFVLGRRLANWEGEGQKIGAFAGIPAMGLDSLSSAAYGPESAMAIMVPLGAASLVYVRPVSFIVLALLLVLYASYRQTIEAYPRGGGSYTVAGDNLGMRPGILAGAALIVDYVLNAAVGISAGIAALVSAVPMLQPYTLPLCLGVLAVITLVNLRGTAEAGMVFATPTYLFILCWVVILGIGVARVFVFGHAAPVVPPPPLPKATESAGTWLLLRSFASGCTAMTGVEAVSNGVTAFREPTVAQAHRTLTLIIFTLALLLAGIAMLVAPYHVAAMDQSKTGYQSVLSQLAGAVVGRGWFYYVSIGSLLAILCLSANTSFNGLPRLLRLMARDHFLPQAFAMPGRRLVYSAGILCLAGAAAALLILFDGITNALIPLFAVGAFLAFTLSQLGMAVHWWRRRQFLKMAVNGFGTLTTAVALTIIVAAKFVEGAWITVVLIPALFLMLLRIRTFYEELDANLRCGKIELKQPAPPLVLIPIEKWDLPAAKALHFAMRLSPDVAGIHLTALEGPEGEKTEAAIRAAWKENVQDPAEAAGLPPPRLVVLHSAFRQFQEPILKIVHQLGEKYPERPVAVLIPEIVKHRWWDHLLHLHRGNALQQALVQNADPQLIVITVPWDVEHVPKGRLFAKTFVSAIWHGQLRSRPGSNIAAGKG